MSMSHRIPRAVTATLTMALLLASAAPAFGNYVYDFTNSPANQFGNGYTWDLSGTIEVTRTGTLSASDIVAYQWTVTAQGSPQSYSFSGTGADATIYGTNPLTGVVATASTLTIEVNNLLLLTAPTGNPSDGNLYWRNDVNRRTEMTMYWSQTFFWFSSGPEPQYISSGNWIIADNGRASVPEIDPATGGSALSFIAGVLAMIEQRRRLWLATAPTA